jgi:hypothetical protein
MTSYLDHVGVVGAVGVVRGEHGFLAPTGAGCGERP